MENLFLTPNWRLPTVLEYCQVSRTLWLDLVKSGTAPAPKRFPGKRAVIWQADEVKAFMQSLPSTKEVAE